MSYVQLLAMLVALRRGTAGSQTFDEIPTHYWAYNFIEVLAETAVTAGCSGDN